MAITFNGASQIERNETETTAPALSGPTPPLRTQQAIYCIERQYVVFAISFDSFLASKIYLKEDLKEDLKEGFFQGRRQHI